MLTRGAVGIYVALGSTLALSGVGLQYDEALVQAGAIDILGRARYPLPQLAGATLHLFGRDARIMALSYLGSPKDYLVSGPIALFGPNPAVGRMTSIVLAAVGIYGVSRLVAEFISPFAGFAVGSLLAVNGAIINHTVFDNSGFAEWIFAVGLLSFAIVGYSRRPRAITALAIGFAVGFGVWNRLNMAWMLLPLMVATGFVFGREVLSRIRHIAIGCLGAIIGGLPFLLFNIRTEFRSFDSTGLVHQSPIAELPHRIRMAATILVADSEDRAIWGGRPVPSGIWFIAGTIVALGVGYAIVVGMRRRDEAAVRLVWISALTLCGFAAFTFASNLVVAEHHTVAFVPLASVVIVGVATLVARRFRWARMAAVGLLCAGLATSLVFNAQAIAGTRRTKGVRFWSSTTGCVADYLRSTTGRGTVSILDWGFTTSIYVLNAGQTSTTNLSWGDRGPGYWRQAVGSARRLLTHAPGSLAYPKSTAAARRSLARLGRNIVTIRFADGSGSVDALLFELRNRDGRWLDRASSDIAAAVARTRERGCDVRVGLSTPTELLREQNVPA